MEEKKETQLNLQQVMLNDLVVELRKRFNSVIKIDGVYHSDTDDICITFKLITPYNVKIKLVSKKIIDRVDIKEIANDLEKKYVNFLCKSLFKEEYEDGCKSLPTSV